MTVKEHDLLVQMFARHEMLLTRIIDTLKTKGNLTAYESAAWDALLTGAEPLEHSYLETTKKEYVAAAEKEGLKVKL
jgi:hypothetical protein